MSNVKRPKIICCIVETPYFCMMNWILCMYMGGNSEKKQIQHSFQGDGDNIDSHHGRFKFRTNLEKFTMKLKNNPISKEGFIPC